mmetsp:Transcript_79383/g.92791  ORF Transcript_79383/g.92791 Transcript_79383/m.92791 type:complete len:89 (+) Transcript_79383:531-797(+)
MVKIMHYQTALGASAIINISIKIKFLIFLERLISVLMWISRLYLMYLAKRKGFIHMERFLKVCFLNQWDYLPDLKCSVKKRAKRLCKD